MSRQAAKEVRGEGGSLRF